MDERSKLLDYLKQKEIMAVFHYIPLHTSIGGKKFGIFHGEDNFTSKESDKLIRLPLYYGLTEDEINYVVKVINDYFNEK